MMRHASVWRWCVLPEPCGCDNVMLGAMAAVMQGESVHHSTHSPPNDHSRLCMSFYFLQTPKPTSVRPCNRIPCPSSLASWAVGPWSDCTATNTAIGCGSTSGLQQRSVACQSSSGEVLGNAVCVSVGPARPSSEAACSMSAQACGCSSDAECGAGLGPGSTVGGHRVCNTTSGRCVCGSGWGGEDCSVPLLQASPGNSCLDGIVDVRGQCCMGYVAVTSGECCPELWIADSVGVCCAPDRVDACGVCNGAGVAVDVHGTCCTSLLPPSGVCCSGGGDGVDSCGVCSGDNQCRWVERNDCFIMGTGFAMNIGTWFGVCMLSCFPQGDCVCARRRQCHQCELLYPGQQSRCPRILCE